MPPKRSGQFRGRNRFPFADMEAGDMFFCPAAEVTSVKSALPSYVKRRPEAKFVVRRFLDGFGVWCVRNQTVPRRKPGPAKGTPRPVRSSRQKTGFFDQPMIDARHLAQRARTVRLEID